MGPDTSTTTDHYNEYGNYYTVTATSGHPDPHDKIEDVIDIEIEDYIDKILKLAKWYIIYTFNCFRIRAPCKS